MHEVQEQAKREAGADNAQAFTDLCWGFLPATECEREAA